MTSLSTSFQCPSTTIPDFKNINIPPGLRQPWNQQPANAPPLPEASTSEGDVADPIIPQNSIPPIEEIIEEPLLPGPTDPQVPPPAPDNLD
jgi:hypothetical protein